MANNVQQYQQPPPPQQQQQQQPPSNSSPHHCKECGLYLNSAESLEVHLQYHKENLLNKWATQATASGGGGAGGQHAANAVAAAANDETNNNTPTTAQQQALQQQQQHVATGAPKIKREFGANAITAAAADSSDSSSMLLKKSPEYGSRATPEINVSFGHPPTPQSYHSASSPYQTPDNSAFSPGFQSYPVKTERASPSHFNQGQQQQQPPLPPPPHHQQQQPNYQSFQEQQFYAMDAGYGGSQQHQDYTPKMGQHSYNRYHPYQQQHSAHQVSSSSPAYPPQPTPSPSPKQCDKCGYVCESASQLIDHLNVAHPPTPAPHLTGNYQQQQQQNHFIFGGNAADGTPSKTEEGDAQSEILDLDSHKVVHQVYPDDSDKRVAGADMNGHHPHSVTAMLSPWPQQQQLAPPPQQQQPPKMFAESFGPPKFHNPQQQQQQQHEYLTPNMMGDHSPAPVAGAYRPFEHMPAQPTAPIISSTQVPSNPVQAPTTNAKGTNWKSNEARRPKTYNCTACNKWFTSSGHLKRHYNTTLHKNAVKSSGQPDPATMPISVHHHPARESSSNREDTSNSPDDSRSEDGYERATGGLLQQPPAGPYDRQPPPNIHHPLHSPMAANTTTLPASPPNGEAGLSASTNNIDSRGLQSISNTPAAMSNHHLHPHHSITSSSNTTTSSISNGFNIAPPGHHHHHHHMMAAATMDNQFQMYPNECAPHATQDTAATTNSLNTTGESVPPVHQQPIEQQQQQQPAEYAVLTPLPAQQPLPSFAQFNNRYGLVLGYNVASVGGPGPVTVPYTATYYTIDVNQQQLLQPQQLQPQQMTPSTMTRIASEDEYKLTVLMPATREPMGGAMVGPFSPSMPAGNGAAAGGMGTSVIITPYSPTVQQQLHLNNNNNNNDYNDDSAMLVDMERKIEAGAAEVGTMQMEPASPEKARIKRDYEETVVTSSTAMTTTPSSKPKTAKQRAKAAAAVAAAQNNNTLGATTPTTQISRDGLHKCFDCDKVFNKSCYLTQHNKTFHTGDKPFKCPRCGKRFSDDDHFHEHLAKHAGDKPHKCELCPKQFNHKTDLRRHMCLHTGQKPYVCDTCRKGFIRKDHMMKHCETHLRKKAPAKAAQRQVPLAPLDKEGQQEQQSRRVAAAR